MAHDRDHDHPPVAEPPPGTPSPLMSRPAPDRRRSERPTAVPRAPVDPRTHPSRAIARALRARPA